MAPVIVVHGGAGAWRVPSARLDEALDACRRAVAAGVELLDAGGTAVDGVEAAVRVLEDAPSLNAGRGSYRNTAGVIEMDALIMDGRSLDAGAVAAAQRVCNPIALARRVMSDTRHVLLVGDGASAFADDIGFPRCETADWAPADQRTPVADTVGAVALDGGGNVAAGTSTGGIPHKMPGRVGDSPLVGAGAYADNETAAVTATGDGEALMKVVISKHVCDLIARGTDVQAACDHAVRTLTTRAHGRGGIIAVDAAGKVGVSFNAPAMPYASAESSGQIRVAFRSLSGR